MEADERPSKLRKRFHDTEVHEERLASPSRSSIPGNPTPTDAGTEDPTEGQSPQHQGLHAEIGSENGSLTKLKNQEETQSIDGRTLSKTQQKKLLKKQEWEAGRESRKVKRKEKIAAKRLRKKEAKSSGESKSGINGEAGLSSTPQQPRSRLHTRLPVTFVIDCGFDNLMAEKERISLGSQLTRSYSDNYRAPLQAHLIVSSWGGLLKERFDTVLSRHYENWRGVRFLEGDFVEASGLASVAMKQKDGGKLAGAFRKYAVSNTPAAQSLQGGSTTFSGTNEGLLTEPTEEKISAREGEQPVSNNQPEIEELQSGRTLQGQLPKTSDIGNMNLSSQHGLESPEVVYLSSDSPYTLQELKPYSTYIIGGLVDKNRHKGICYKTARDKGIKTAKLPIGEYMEMQSRFVLATNHVVAIMIRWLETGDWGEAFLHVMPKRKGGRLRKQIAEEGGVETPVSGLSEDEDASDEEEAGQIVHSSDGESDYPDGLLTKEEAK